MRKNIAQALMKTLTLGEESHRGKGSMFVRWMMYLNFSNKDIGITLRLCGPSGGMSVRVLVLIPVNSRELASLISTLKSFGN